MIIVNVLQKNARASGELQRHGVHVDGIRHWNADGSSPAHIRAFANAIAASLELNIRGTRGGTRQYLVGILQGEEICDEGGIIRRVQVRPLPPVLITEHI
jgi:hypothetical protein